MDPLNYEGPEKRITFQLFHLWDKLAGARDMPQLKDLNPDDIAPFKENMTLIDLRDPTREPMLQVVGNDLEQDLDEELSNKPISDIPRRTMLSRVTDHYLECIANRAPISFEAEFVNKERKKALYRGILLPFSDDGSHINFVLGAVRWKLEEDIIRYISDELGNPPASGVGQDVKTREEAEKYESSDFIFDLDGDTKADLIELDNPALPDQMSDEENVEKPDDVGLLADLLHCQNLIYGGPSGETRSRKSLYNALAAIMDFYEQCQVHSLEYKELLKSEGLKSQKRAPFTPILKLCFGKNYDKTRITEYAAALNYARRHKIPSFKLPAFLENFPGGIKGCVQAERNKKAGQKPVKQDIYSLQTMQQHIQNMTPLGQMDISDDMTLPSNKEAPEDIFLLLGRRSGQTMDVVQILNEPDHVIKNILRRLHKEMLKDK